MPKMYENTMNTYITMSTNAEVEKVWPENFSLSLSFSLERANNT